MPIIYHITTSSAWDKAKLEGAYTAPSLINEGFIHCSHEDQLADVKQRYFQETTDLVLLTIDTDLLSSQFIFEWSPSVQNTFPHVYGPIDLSAVVGLKSY
jgi:uncharacterized protein (DUF952 family)